MQRFDEIMSCRYIARKNDHHDINDYEKLYQAHYAQPCHKNYDNHILS